MNNYENLLRLADNEKLITKEKPLRANKGRIKNNRIAIKKNMSQSEKACTLAEELGHHYTSTGDILDQSDTANQKQEHKARVWAYQKLITFDRLIEAFENGCRNRYEVADFLDVTEEFLMESVSVFSQKHGAAYKYKDYTLIFNGGLWIMKEIK